MKKGKYFLRRKQKAFLLALVAVVIVLLLRFYVFGVGEEEKFIGTWKRKGGLGETVSFYDDGTCSISGLTMNWEIKNDNRLVFTVQDEVQFTYTYSFSDDLNTLKLTTSGITTTYIKQ